VDGMHIANKVKLIKSYPWKMYSLKVSKPNFIESLEQLYLKEGVAVLDTVIREGIIVDTLDNVAFVYCTVTSLLYLDTLMGYKGGRHEKEYYPLIKLEELQLGRWKIRRGDLRKADSFRKKYNIKLIGPRDISSYDLRGEIVR
jgi:hypothetical protein